MKHIRQGNTFNFRYSLYRVVGDQKEPEDLTGLTIAAVLKNRLYATEVDVPFTVEGNVVSAQIPGLPFLKTGLYNFCLSYRKDGEDFTIDTDAFRIVDSSAQTGGTNSCLNVKTESVDLSGSVGFGGIDGGSIEQVQADWEENDPESKAFIRRKPLLSKVAATGSYEDLSDKPLLPTVSNDFSDEEKSKLARLENYDDTEVRRLIAEKANAVRIQSVSNPTQTTEIYAIDPNVFYDFGLCGTLHLSLNPPADPNVLNEYMFQFIAADSQTALVIDGPIRWLNEMPAMKQNYAYQVSIVNRMALIGGTEYVEI